ncbi:MAG: hypothetical protein CMP65_02225 [Flavobacteriales bacterium]|nr:hypothetical protein [Flavobacteriales bacterium]
MSKNKLLITFFIILGILTRLIPHPPNFTAIGAIAVFGGAYISDKKLSFIIPTIIMLISDLLLGYEIQLSVYVSFILMVGCGFLLKKNIKTKNIISIAFLSSIIFFIITNFQVFLTSNMYSNDINGLFQCYLLAIPFFTNTLLGNIFYSLLIFHAFDYVKSQLLVLN